MNSLSEHMSRCWHWVLRFRHRCGYGVHSPFAFSFITGVVYETGEYYAYATLRNQWRDKRIRHSVRLKDLLLIFRLSNFQEHSSCLVIGLQPGDAESRSLMAGNRRSRLVFQEEAEGSTFDMIYAQTDWMGICHELPGKLNEGGMLVVHDIAGTSQRRAAWQRLCSSEQAVVTFDLRDFGIVMNRPQLQRQHYRVNYF